MIENELTGKIITVAMNVHSSLGPGLLESAYESCLVYGLRALGLKVERQKELPVVYEGVRVNCGYRLDLLVEDSVIVELKATEKIQPVHHAQLLIYLKITKKRIGLLINFCEQHLRDGIVRKINDRLCPPASVSSVV